jgi:aminoglycoside N3'-acetyltransferase
VEAPWSTARLAGDLARLGVMPGDSVMVHASLRRLGPVDGGAAGVVAAIEAAVGRDGTILMTIGARDEWSWVNDQPEDAREELLAEAEPFDPLATPAHDDMGVLAEVFRTMPGTRVSHHPEGRFGARGRLADELTRDVPWDDYYGPDSPLARLVEHHGKVLRLGADPNTVTLLHYAEYLARVPDKIRVLRHRRVLGPNGPEVRTVECLDDTLGIVDWPEDYFPVILAEYLASGAAAQGIVGHASSELLDARDIVAFAARWMTERFRR